MRIEKKNLPNNSSITSIKTRCVLACCYFFVVVAITYTIVSRRQTSDLTTTGAENIGDFYQTKPMPGELSLIRWREDGSYVAPNG